MTEQVELEVNGEVRSLPPGSSLDDLVGALGVDRRGMAIAVDDEVVPRRRWPQWRLASGSRVEILTIAQGG